MHQLTENELASHNHIIQARANTSSPAYITVQGASNGQGANRNTDSTGGNQPHNNMPPYLSLNYIIKF